MGEQVLVFDLDDTLYLERDFAASGFRAVDAWLANHLGAEGFAGHCEAAAASGHSGRVFDTALAAIGIAIDEALVGQLVAVYRGHRPEIALADDARRYLERARVGRRAIITDGPAATQQAKVKALGLEALVDRVIFTDLWGREFWKPHARPMRRSRPGRTSSRTVSSTSPTIRSRISSRHAGADGKL